MCCLTTENMSVINEGEMGRSVSQLNAINAIAAVIAAIAIDSCSNFSTSAVQVKFLFRPFGFGDLFSD